MIYKLKFKDSAEGILMTRIALDNFIADIKSEYDVSIFFNKIGSDRNTRSCRIVNENPDLIRENSILAFAQKNDCYSFQYYWFNEKNHYVLVEKEELKWKQLKNFI